MFGKKIVTTAKERHNANMVVYLIVGIVFVIGSCWYVNSILPSFDFSVVQAEFTSTNEGCNASWEKKKHEDGYKYVYEFKAGRDTFYGSGLHCYHLRESKSDIGEKVWIVYNNDDPNTNTRLLSFLYAALALVAGLLLIFYYMYDKQKQQASQNRFQP